MWVPIPDLMGSDQPVGLIAHSYDRNRKRHSRNITLFLTIRRCMTFCGHPVEAQNNARRMWVLSCSKLRFSVYLFPLLARSLALSLAARCMHSLLSEEGGIGSGRKERATLQIVPRWRRTAATMQRYKAGSSLVGIFNRISQTRTKPYKR